jgi:putative ABC transport system ATP-binding protein
VSESILSVERINVKFGVGNASMRALSDVSLSFPAESLTLVMGPSGSGKTTLLSVLGCLLVPDDGSVFVNGRDVTAATEEERTTIRREQLGFVFQAFRLFESLTAFENVALSSEISGQRGAQSDEKAERCLERLGLVDKKHLRPAELSGGEKQRVAIARALMREPKILLADEPTASLDSSTGERIAEILREIAQDQGRTVVVVSHDERLRAFATHVVCLRDGRVEGNLPTFV